MTTLPGPRWPAFECDRDPKDVFLYQCGDVDVWQVHLYTSQFRTDSRMTYMARWGSNSSHVFFKDMKDVHRLVEKFGDLMVPLSIRLQLEGNLT